MLDWQLYEGLTSLVLGKVKSMGVYEMRVKSRFSLTPVSRGSVRCVIPNTPSILDKSLKGYGTELYSAVQWALFNPHGEGGEWNVGMLRDMSAPCLQHTPTCLPACLPGQKVKTGLFSRSINPCVQFYPVITTTLTVLCVLCSKYVNFSATKPPLSTHCSAKKAPTLIHWWLQKRLTHICGFSCLRVERELWLVQETWPLFHHNDK